MWVIRNFCCKDSYFSRPVQVFRHFFHLSPRRAHYITLQAAEPTEEPPAGWRVAPMDGREAARSVAVAVDGCPLVVDRERGLRRRVRGGGGVGGCCCRAGGRVGLPRRLGPLAGCQCHQGRCGGHCPTCPHRADGGSAKPRAPARRRTATSSAGRRPEPGTA